MTVEADQGRTARLLAALDPEQRQAALTTRGPVCILAGAGTGKTHTITSRIAHAVETGLPASQILAVTFTSRAAGEMRARLRSLGISHSLTGGGGVQALTFHAAALRQLRYFAPRVLGGPMPLLTDSKIRLLAKAVHQCQLPSDKSMLADVATEIEWAKATLVSPANYGDRARAVNRRISLEFSVVARIYEQYEAVKSAAGVIDYEDLLLVMAAAIEQHNDVADEIRARYRHFVVDEYQDVNPLQQRLLDGWLGNRDDLCVVGDPSQTIYSFNGASPDYLLNFPRRFPGATIVRLERDYRSTPQVVALANRVIATASGPCADVQLRLIGQRSPGPKPKLTEYADEPTEAAAIATACAKLIADGLAPHNIAVLFRINAQSQSYEQACADAGVPYQVAGGVRFFERPDVRQAMALLRAATRAGDVADQALSTVVRDVLSGMGWSPGGGIRSEKWESLSALVALAQEFAATEQHATLIDFVAELDRRAADQHPPPSQGVVLASLHAAKGLEWDAVFLAGVTDGLLPIHHAVTAEQIEEERRLLYVGITRARERLQLSWSLARTPGDRRQRRRSRFLVELTESKTGKPAKTTSTPTASRGQLRACRLCGSPLCGAHQRARQLCDTCPSDLNDALLDELRVWRRAQADRQKVPAFVIFADSTLIEIARNCPDTLVKLHEIPGIGEQKLAQYGEHLLTLVKVHN